MKSAILVLFYVVMLVGGIPFFLLCVLFGWREAVYAYGRWAMTVTRAFLRIPVETRGFDPGRWPRPAIFMANHASFVDGPLLCWQNPRNPRVIFKKQLMVIPILGWMMKFVGFVPVDRKGAGGGQAGIARAVRSIRERGDSFLVFPEGTRTRDGRLQPFRRGGFFLAVESGAPIVPVSVRGTWAMMPRGRASVRRGRITVVYHDPIASGGGTDGIPALMERVRTAIRSGLDEETGAGAPEGR